MFDGFLPASKVKKNKNYAIPASVTRNFGVCQPAVAQAKLWSERASKVPFNTHCQEKHKSQQARSVLRQIYII